MKVATILPTAYLQHIEDDSYHMCLAQLIGKDEKYTLFYQEQTKWKHRFVIMDNGAAEKAQLSIDELLARAQLVRPHELVLPDVIYDKRATLHRSYKALEVIHSQYSGGRPFRLMAVPQGRTFEEWYQCAGEMMKWPIDTIGVSKFMTPQMGPYVRLRAVDALLAGFIGSHHFDIHLLGCWASPREVAHIGRVFGAQVRGVDSAIAFVHTAHDKVLHPYAERPKGEVDFGHTGVDQNLLKTNIYLWRRFCNAV